MRELKEARYTNEKCVFPKSIIRDILDIMKNKAFFFFLIAAFLIMGASTLSAKPDIEKFSTQTEAILQLNKEKTVDSEEQSENIGEQSENIGEQVKTIEETQLPEDSELPFQEPILPEQVEETVETEETPVEQTVVNEIQAKTPEKEKNKAFSLKVFASYPVFLDVSSSDEANTRIKTHKGFSAGIESLYRYSFMQFGLSGSYTANSVYDTNDYSSIDILVHAGMATKGDLGFRFDLFYGLDIIRYKSKSSMCQLFGAGIYADIRMSDVLFAEIGGRISFVPQEGKASYITQRIMPTAAIGVNL